MFTTQEAIDGTLALLSSRASGGTVCPSEVARRLATAAGAATAGDWRDAMPAVHEAVDRLVEQGQAKLSWKGKPLAARAGPYRIARG